MKYVVSFHNGEPTLWVGGTWQLEKLRDGYEQRRIVGGEVVAVGGREVAEALRNRRAVDALKIKAKAAA